MDGLAQNVEQIRQAIAGAAKLAVEEVQDVIGVRKAGLSHLSHPRIERTCAGFTVTVTVTKPQQRDYSASVDDLLLAAQRADGQERTSTTLDVNGAPHRWVTDLWSVRRGKVGGDVLLQCLQILRHGPRLEAALIARDSAAILNSTASLVRAASTLRSHFQRSRAARATAAEAYGGRAHRDRRDELIAKAIADCFGAYATRGWKGVLEATRSDLGERGLDVSVSTIRRAAKKHGLTARALAKAGQGTRAP